MRTKVHVLCDASRQRDGRTFGLLDYVLHYAPSGTGTRELALATPLGLKTTKSANSEQADPAPQDEDSTRPGDQGQGSEEQQCVIGMLDSGPAVVLVTRDRMFQAAGPGGGRTGEVGLGLLDSAARKKCRQGDGPDG